MKQILLILSVYLGFILILAALVTKRLQRSYPHLPAKLIFLLLTLFGLLFAPIPYEGDITFLLARLIHVYQGLGA